MTNSKTFAAFALCLAAVLAIFTAPPIEAQTILTTTTLASAVTTTYTTSIQLTSSTGLVAGASAIFVADTASTGEAMFVNSVGTGGFIGVTRGYQTLGKARTHASGTPVFLLTNTQAGIAANTIQPSGSCTRTAEPFLPVISFGEYGQNTVISDCVGGVWVNGNSGINTAGPWAPQYFPDPGGTIYTSLNTNGTTLTGGAGAGASTQYCTEIDVKQSKYATGLAPLVGTTGGTDKWIVALYDATGNLLANSALAGTTVSATASAYDQIPFTSKYYVVAPAKYYACMQSNGTTATERMLVTSVQDAYTTKGIASQTFGTLPNPITVPTTFTTAVGPYWQLY